MTDSSTFAVTEGFRKVQLEPDSSPWLELSNRQPAHKTQKIAGKIRNIVLKYYSSISGLMEDKCDHYVGEGKIQPFWGKSGTAPVR